MNEVTRFKFVLTQCGNYMQSQPDGEYVLAHEYDALRTEHTQLLDRNVDLRCMLTKQIKRLETAKHALNSIAESEATDGDTARAALAELALWEPRP